MTMFFDLWVLEEVYWSYLLRDLRTTFLDLWVRCQVLLTLGVEGNVLRPLGQGRGVMVLLTLGVEDNVLGPLGP